MGDRCRFIRETDLGPPVIAWLEDEGFDVYQEAGADIVAIRGALVGIVELKLSITWRLLEQCIDGTRNAQLVWAATRERQHGIERGALMAFCQFGIGLLEVGESVREVRRPTFNRRVDSERLRKSLRPEHKHVAAAGSPHPTSWTPFKETVRDLLALVRLSPGITLREALGGDKGIKHHYASDSCGRARLASLIQDGIVNGIRLERDGRAVRLFPKEQI